MAVHALPLTKLAGLLIKTLSKPLSKRIKHEFSRWEITQRLLIGIGRVNHQITSRMTIWSAGYKVRSITPLEEEKALKEGAEFIGESVIFLVSGFVVIFEYNRSQTKTKEKDEIRRAQAKAERQALKAQLKAIDARLQEVEKLIQQNAERNSDISKTKSWWSGWWGSSPR
ncbi:hypothetical protein ACA910_001000 [Epithemia clementina (nom. ined.)]